MSNREKSRVSIAKNVAHSTVLATVVQMVQVFRDYSSRTRILVRKMHALLRRELLSEMSTREKLAPSEQQSPKM